MTNEKIHLSELNEYIAAQIIKNENSVEVSIGDYTFDGYLNVEIQNTDVSFGNKTMDFDLQGCECSGLNEYDTIDEYVGKTLYASSLREFAEFIFDASSSSKMLVNIKEGSWVISLISYS